MHLNATPLRLVALLCVSLLATMAPGAHTAVPTADAATAGTAAAAAAAIPLADVLAADGSIRTDTGINAPLDMAGWSLLSNLSAGDAPRFAKTAPAGPTTAGWNALGDNGAGDGALTGGIYTIAVSGSDVYVGGQFTDAAGIATADNIAKWNGSAWSALGDNGAGDGALNGGVNAIAVVGSDVYVGGDFQNAAGIATADWVATWNGSTWSALGSNGAGDGALNNSVFAIAVSGSDAYVGGNFTNAAGVAAADNLAKWDGSAWSALGDNGAGDGALNSYLNTIAVSGSDVYAGGNFTNAAGIATADYLATWNGSAWSALGDNGAGNGALNNIVEAIVISGSDVYAGGGFTNAATIATADYLATWNGSAWSALGSNGAGNGALNSDADAIAIAGGNVYAAGYFADAAGIATADRVAIWNGSAQPQPTPGGETATPSLPPTDTGGAGTDGPGSLGQFLLSLAGLLMAVRLLTPSRALSRKS